MGAIQFISLGRAIKISIGSESVESEIDPGIVDTLLPDQAGNAGKILTTDGSTLSWVGIGDEDIVSDGTGVITLANNYVSMKWRVFLRGVLVRKTDVSETGASELTLSVSTRVGDIINVQYYY